MKLTGRPIQPAGTQNGTAADTAELAAADAPIFTRIGEPTLLASSAAPATANDATPADQATTASTANPQATTSETAISRRGQGAAADPNVVHLRDAPDRETQRNLMAQHKRWSSMRRLARDSSSSAPTAVFGWDDFLDVINPLQHIPIVAQIYRAVTGDQINGAAELIGSLPLGPIGIIGTMGTIADLAVKDTTARISARTWK